MKIQILDFGVLVSLCSPQLRILVSRDNVFEINDKLPSLENYS